MRAGHRVRGVGVEAVRARLDRRRVGRLRRRARPVLEVEVEVHGLRPARANLRREDEVRRGVDGAGLREQLPEGNRAVRKVDPGRLLGGIKHETPLGDRPIFVEAELVGRDRQAHASQRPGLVVAALVLTRLQEPGALQLFQLLLVVLALHFRRMCVLAFFFMMRGFLILVCH